MFNLSWASSPEREKTFPGAIPAGRCYATKREAWNSAAIGEKPLCPGQGTQLDESKRGSITTPRTGAPNSGRDAQGRRKRCALEAKRLQSDCCSVRTLNSLTGMKPLVPDGPGTRGKSQLTTSPSWLARPLHCCALGGGFWLVPMRRIVVSGFVVVE